MVWSGQEGAFIVKTQKGSLVSVCENSRKFVNLDNSDDFGVIGLSVE